MGFNLSFTVDPLAVGMAIVSSLVGSIIVLYSFGYIGHYDNRNEYYLTVVLFLGSMMGIIFSSNLILLFVFWELTAICSWRLVGFFRGKNDVLRADKTFLVTVFGALVMLIGFISLQLGIFNLLPIPVMDGGVILLLLVEGAMRRDLSLHVKERFVQVGIVFLLLLAVFVMFNDIVKTFRPN
jgi:NADH:ubiquinone oxidoreductase subunit 5 (subunit L)/multisubunit Na+/H+ antiporter MnhA subunit